MVDNCQNSEDQNADKKKGDKKQSSLTIFQFETRVLLAIELEVKGMCVLHSGI